MKNNTLILYSSVFHQQIREYINKNIGSKYFGLITDDDIYHPNDLKFIKFIEPKDYLELNELYHIDKTSIEIAKNWYLKNINDLSKINNVSIGKVCQYDIMNISCQVLHSYSLVSKVIKKENINSIIIFSTNKYFIISGQNAAIHFNISLFNLKNYEKALIPKFNIKNEFLKIINKYDSLVYSTLNFYKNKSHISIFHTHRNDYFIKQLAKNYKIHLFTTRPILNFQILFNKNIKITKLKQITLHKKDNNFVNALINHFNLFIQNNYNNDINNLLTEVFIQSKISGFLKLYISYTNTNTSKLFIRNTKLAIVGQDFNGIPRLLVEMANQNNIHSLVMQHGIYGHFPYFVSPIAKYIAIWGEKWKEWISSLDNTTYNIIVTGEPYYDKLLKIKRAGNHLEKINILIPFQPNVTISSLSDYSENEQKIIRILNSLSIFEKKISVTLKMRNNGQIKHGYRINELSHFKSSLSVIGQTNNFQLLKNTDVLISTGSTMAFEALLLNKIVLIENFGKIKINKLNPFYSNELTMKFNSTVELESIINDIIENRFSNKYNQNNHLHNLIANKYYIEGEAFDRTLNEIKNIL